MGQRAGKGWMPAGLTVKEGDSALTWGPGRLPKLNPGTDRTRSA